MKNKRMTNKIWITKDGKEMLISNMATKQIKSTINLLVENNSNNVLGILNKLEPFYQELEGREEQDE